MSIYEYKCRSCARVSEILVHGFSNPQPVICPVCSGDTEKCLSSPALVTEKSGKTGGTCCGREERCDKPPCSGGRGCHHH